MSNKEGSSEGVSTAVFSAIFVGIVLLYLLSVYWLTSSHALPFNPFNSFYSLSLSLGTGVFVFYFLCIRIVRVIFSRPEGPLLVAIWKDVSSYLTVRRLATAAPILMMPE